MTRQVLLLALLALFVSLAVGGEYGPPICGNTGHNCVDGYAQCQGGKCVCQLPNVWGMGNFGCYRPNTVAAEVKNDPTLTTFNNQTVLFPYPCRYLVTHVRQELKDRHRDVIGHCEFKIYASNMKHKGKFFSTGFDVAARINYDDGRELELSSSNTGTAADGYVQFNTAGTVGAFLPNGPWGSDEIEYHDNPNDIHVEVKQNHANQQLIYEFNKCGLRITFVPYDIEKRRSQVTVPGLSVAINCAMHPVWLSLDKVIALAPKWQEGDLLKDVRLPGLSDEQTILNRAFTGMFHQNSWQDTDGQCERTGSMLAMCDDQHREIAFDRCYWILKQPRFIRCYDDTGNAQNILELFNMCVDMVCGYGRCSQVQDKITESGCANVDRVPELASFMAGDLCYSMY